MIRLWISFVCCMHLYIKWQIWSLGLSCTIDGSRIEGHASLSSKHDGKHDYAYMCLKSHAILSVLCLLSKLSSAGSFCRPAEFSADRQSLKCRWLQEQPVEIVKCRWEFCLAGGALQSARTLSRSVGNYHKDRAVQTEVAEIWYGFFRRAGFRARIIRASRGRGCGHPLLSFAFFLFLIN